MPPCAHCNAQLPNAQFSKDQRGKGRLRKCKACVLGAAPGAAAAAGRAKLQKPIAAAAAAKPWCVAEREAREFMSNLGVAPEYVDEKPIDVIVKHAMVLPGRTRSQQLVPLHMSCRVAGIVSRLRCRLGRTGLTYSSSGQRHTTVSLLRLCSIAYWTAGSY